MKKVIVLYGSTMGNTEKMTQIIGDVFKPGGVSITIANVRDKTPADLCEYDYLLLGSSTWGDGELQDDWVSFEKDMEQVNLAGKSVACFGPGDSMYPQFCKAVDMLEERAKACGATVITEGLKIDGEVDAQAETIREWSEKIVSLCV
ncbi:MAG: flavodoxin [Candidatus Moranbacteria bacterium]|nr:flavodoxin [Candidatus Moranbacteria bacterium]